MCIGRWSHSTPLRRAMAYRAAPARGFPADKAKKKPSTLNLPDDITAPSSYLSFPELERNSHCFAS